MHRLSTTTNIDVSATHSPAVEQCAICLGQRAVWEPSILGLVPVICDRCAGTGRSLAHHRVP